MKFFHKSLSLNLLKNKFLRYDSIISLGFDTYFSYVTHKDKREKNTENEVVKDLKKNQN